MLQKLTIRTTQKYQILDITKILNDLLMKNSYYDGICFLFCQDGACAITTLNIDEASTTEEYEALKQITSSVNQAGPANSVNPAKTNNQSTLKDYLAASGVGMSLTIPVQSASLALGFRQKVVLIENLGPGERHITVNFLKEEAKTAL